MHRLTSIHFLQDILATYVFGRDHDKYLTTYSGGGRRGSHKKVLLKGILTVKSRLIQETSVHTDLAVRLNTSASSPLKGALEKKQQPVAYVFEWQWLAGGEHQTWYGTPFTKSLRFNNPLCNLILRKSENSKLYNGRHKCHY